MREAIAERETWTCLRSTCGKPRAICQARKPLPDRAFRPDRGSRVVRNGRGVIGHARTIGGTDRHAHPNQA